METKTRTCGLMLIVGVLQCECIIQLFKRCEEEITIENNAKLALEISGSDWKRLIYACPLTFRATGPFDLVYYQFDSFDVNNKDLEIKLLSSTERAEGYHNQGMYGMKTSPPLSTMRTAGRYFRVMVTRTQLSSYDISVSLQIYAKAGAQGTGLKTGQIVGVVIGSVVFIILLVVLIVCCAIGAKYPDRRGSIYTVARRLSIFAIQDNGTGQADNDSQAGIDVKSQNNDNEVSQENEGFKLPEEGEQEAFSMGYIVRTGQPSSARPVSTNT